MTHYHFDRYGRYLGYLDESGRYYDSGGACQGYVVSGEFYDTLGNRRGRIDVMGNFYDECGTCRGYLRRSHPTAPASPFASLASPGQKSA